jgi:hypothetical protein
MRGFWRWQTPVSFLASIIWNLSEDKILPPLGILAKPIFNLMMGSFGKSTKNKNTK